MLCVFVVKYVVACVSLAIGFVSLLRGLVFTFVFFGMFAIEGVFLWVWDVRGQCFWASRVALWAAYVWCLCVVDVDARWFLIVLHGGVSFMAQI